MVEDDDAIASALEIGLKREGFDAVRAGSAAQALNSLPVDFILLDLGLPDRDGIELFHNLRAITTAPIIMVTARGSEQNRIEGLDLGADDYVVKPFGFHELVARINAVLRRTAHRDVEAPTQVLGPIEID
ncbi:MAG TPA: response regulator transcription factor, partial [Acidimicrobiales bacterium]